jgi:hypothetical protein
MEVFCSIQKHIFFVVVSGHHFIWKIIPHLNIFAGFRFLFRKLNQ